MCALSIKVPIRKKSGDLFNEPRTCVCICLYASLCLLLLSLLLLLLFNWYHDLKDCQSVCSRYFCDKWFIISLLPATQDYLFTWYHLKERHIPIKHPWNIWRSSCLNLAVEERGGFVIILVTGMYQWLMESVVKVQEFEGRKTDNAKQQNS